MIKRFLDFFGAATLLALGALPLAAVALAVKLTSKGPVRLRQRWPPFLPRLPGLA